MFRLIKLTAYSLLGLVLYELFLGITEEVDRRQGRRKGDPSRQGDREQGQPGGSREFRRAMNEDRGRMRSDENPGRQETGHPTTQSHQPGRGVTT